MANDLIEIGINVRSNADEATRGLNQLESTVVKQLRTVERLERGYKKLDNALNAGKISAQTYARGVQQVDAAIEQVWDSSKRATKVIEQQNAAMMRGARGINRTGVAMQQFGYQAGDFIVQVQSGTNAFVAFGQQATQMAGLLTMSLNPRMIALGTALSIIIPLSTALGAALMRTSEGGGQLNAEFEKLEGILKPVAPLLDGIISAFVEMKELALDAVNLVVNNLDRLVVFATTAAVFFGGRFVAAFVAARLATLNFATALTVLRGALIRTGIGALIVGAGELIYQFTRLVSATGGIGEAFSAMFNVGKAVFEGIITAAGAIPPAIQAYGQRIKADWNLMLSDLLEAFSEFLQGISDRMPDFGPFAGLSAAVEGAATSAMRASGDFAAAAAEASAAADALGTEASGKVQSGFDKVREALGALRDTTEDFDIRNVFTGSDGESGSEAAAKVTEEVEKLEDVLDGPLKSSIEGVSNAWADFVMRGFQDFSSFKDAVVNSFKNMIAQMIAIAARNRIMIGLGMSGGGVAGGAGNMLFGGGGDMLSSLAGGAQYLMGGTGGFTGAFGAGLGASLTGGVSGGLGAFTTGIGMLGGGGGAGLAGLGMAAGAALPAIGAIAVGAKLLGGLFGGSKPILGQEQFDALAEAALLTGQNFNNLGAELQGVEKGTYSLTKATQQLILDMANAAGGVEEFTQKAQFFYQNFYTEGERQQRAMQESMRELNEQFAELNVAIPATHQEYRNLIEAQDLTTEAGREMYTSLLNAAEAFVAVKGSADQAAAAQREVISAGEATSRRDEMAQSRLTQYFDTEARLRNLEENGTTLEQNEYLMNQFVADYNEFVKEFNSGNRGGLDLKPIDRETLENLTNIDETLGQALENTTLIQKATLNFYTGVKKTQEQLERDFKELGLGGKDLRLAMRDGILPEGFNLPEGFLYSILPYYLEVALFVKDMTRIAANIRSSANGIIADLSGVSDISIASGMLDQISQRITAGFSFLEKGYDKVIEATDKIKTFYRDAFSEMSASYNVNDIATQTQAVSFNIEEILNVPKRLIETLDRAMSRLEAQRSLYQRTVSKVTNEMQRMVRENGAVTDEMQKSYDDIINASRSARRKADKARQELAQLNLFITTVETALGEFESAVEQSLVAPIEEGLKFYEPSFLSGLSDNVRLQMINMLQAMTEGGYAAFEENFVRLTDFLASEKITVDQFNTAFGTMRDVFLGNISLTEEYTTKQLDVIERLSTAYDEFTDKLQRAVSVVQDGIAALTRQLTGGVGARGNALAYLRSVAATGQFDQDRLSGAVSEVTSGSTAGFSTRVEFLRSVADTANLLRSVEGTLQGQLETLEMQQVKAILNIQDTNETAANALESIESLLAEFLGVGGRVPAFASGGYHSGGLRIVGENGPELEATGPSRIISNRQLSLGSDPDLKREVAQMRADLNTALVQIAKNTRKSADTLNKFDYQGLPQDRGY